MMIPRLETERLVLREWRPDDFECFVAIMADAEVARYLPGGHAMGRMDTWRFVTGMIGVWTMRGYGTWVVERKSDGAVMGRIGLIHPDGWPGLEVGWTLGREFWGQGYATEAAKVSLDYAFMTQPVAEVVSTIHPENRASQGVAKNIGETIGPRVTLDVGGGTLYTCDVWAITRTVWEGRFRTS
jgi:RimJ/RimL family protein N-acetyltransferase